MRKSIPMSDFEEHLRGDGLPPRRLIGMSFQLGIPWQVALQQSLPPLSQPQLFCKNGGWSVEQISADGSCLTSPLSQKGPQSSGANWQADQGFARRPFRSTYARNTRRFSS